MRERVESALLRGESVRSIEKWIDPPLSQPSISKYAHKLGATLAIVRAAKQSAAANPTTANQDVVNFTELSLARAVQSADPFVSRLERKYERLDAGLTKTYKDEDFSAAAKLETAETQAMRLHAELEGRLSSTQTSQVTIQVAMIGVQPAPSTPQQTIIEADVVD